MHSSELFFCGDICLLDYPVQAPVIIFVEDFDLFAGVRGKFIHTKKQDHEAFINQLLVELDG